MERKSRYRLFFVSVALGMIVCALFSGCEAGFSFNAESKALYPDRYGKESFLGDPRKPMYEGSGFTESRGAGSGSDIKGFKGMGGDR